MRQSFTFLRSYYEAIKELPAKVQNELYRAIIEFSFEEIEPVFKDKNAKSYWMLIEPNLKSSFVKFRNGTKNRVERNRSETEAKQKRNGSEMEATLSYEIDIEKDIEIDIENNIYYKDNELNNLFIDFLEVRKKIKAVNSSRAISMLLKKLSLYSDDIKRKMIEQSIVNSWKDVYTVKEETLKQKTSTEKMNDVFSKFLAKEDNNDKNRIN